ncbi:hypothetical protein BUALT_Bualt14G0029300 [Buddleja alternifolia]|uniref:anthocyanidin 3-O-glucoside 5-O-glucosyltransferase n=1 Tax=Buddleja alternifolia TaxID=168488 RepID=A0AAV6WHC2_9LAMI|nr:hypothetical protein BUALT_Bualt14G0029300 [Buddleja alternifolia]
MKHHHFLIISFPVQGHINPTLQLAKNLARGGAKVTFATTVRGLQRVQDSLPTLNGLSYATISDGHDEESIKPGGDIVGYMADLRRVGSQNLTEIVHKFLDEGRPVTCLVYTLLLPWAAAVARDMHVTSAFVSIQCATAFAIYHQFFNSHNGIHENWNIESSVIIPKLPLFASSDLPTLLLPDNPMNPLMVPIMREHIQELEKDSTGSLVFLNTFQELEKEAIKYLEDKMSVIAIGPLVPSAFSDGNDSTDKSFGGDLFIKNEDYFHWLNLKPENSVVYVSFGSLVVMSKEQKVEILHGLLESKRPFLWVIRSSDNEEEEGMKKMLENEVNNGDGIIVPWCSQMEVLSHKSIGSFVTHCGWNSTLESLVCGVPSIGCPHFSDQTTDAKMVEEVWGSGVRARANGEVMIERNELKKYLEIVMGDGERGKEIRRNALKWKALAIEAVKDGGSTYNNLKRVLEKSGLDS